MPIQDVDYSPSADKIKDFADKFNNNNGYYIVNVTQSGSVVTLTRQDAGTFTIDLPAGVDQVLTGLAVTIGGVGPYTADYTAGTYQISGTNYSILVGGSLPISAAHPTLDRIDAVVVDTTGTALLLAGTPAATPAAPTVVAGQLLVTYIYIAAASVPIVQPPVTGLPAGLNDGDTLHWDANVGEWRINPDFTHDGATADMKADTLLNFHTDTSTEASVLLQNGSASVGVDNGGTTNQVLKITSAGFELAQDSTTQAELNVNLNGGIKLKSVVPTGVRTGKIWRDGTELWWNDTGYVVTQTDAGIAVAVTTTATILRDNGGGQSGGFNSTNTVTRIFHKDGTVDMQVRLDNATDEIQLFQNDTTEITVNVDVGGGIKIRDSVPTVTTEKIYNDSGTLYWDGSPIGGGGWDGYADYVDIDSSDSPYLVAPTTPFYHISVHADAPITIDLPAAPTDKQIIFIKDRTYNAGSNNITIDGNGKDIDANSPYTINVSGGAVILKYSSANDNWEVISAYQLPLLTPATVFGGVGQGLVVYAFGDVSLTSTGNQNIMQLPSGAGKFVWTEFQIVTKTITGFSAPASVEAGWGGTPQQIIGSPTALAMNVVDKQATFEPGSVDDVVPDGEQIILNVTTAATATVYDVDVYIIGYHR